MRSCGTLFCLSRHSWRSDHIRPALLLAYICSPSTVVLAVNAIQSSEFLSPAQQEALVAALLKGSAAAAAAAAQRRQAAAALEDGQ